MSKRVSLTRITQTILDVVKTGEWIPMREIVEAVTSELGCDETRVYAAMEVMAASGLLAVLTDGRNKSVWRMRDDS